MERAKILGMENKRFQTHSMLLRHLVRLLVRREQDELWKYSARCDIPWIQNEFRLRSVSHRDPTETWVEAHHLWQ